MKKLKPTRYITRKLHNQGHKNVNNIIVFFATLNLFLIGFIIGFTIDSFFKLDTEYYFFPILNLILILYYLSSKYGKEKNISIKEYDKFFKKKILIVLLIFVLSISIDFSSSIFVTFLLICEIMLISAMKTIIEKNKIIYGNLWHIRISYIYNLYKK